MRRKGKAGIGWSAGADERRRRAAPPRRRDPHARARHAHEAARGRPLTSTRTRASPARRSRGARSRRRSWPRCTRSRTARTGPRGASPCVSSSPARFVFDVRRDRATRRRCAGSRARGPRRRSPAAAGARRCGLLCGWWLASTRCRFSFVEHEATAAASPSRMSPDLVPVVEAEAERRALERAARELRRSCRNRRPRRSRRRPTPPFTSDRI